MLPGSRGCCHDGCFKAAGAQQAALEGVCGGCLKVFCSELSGDAAVSSRVLKGAVIR